MSGPDILGGGAVGHDLRVKDVGHDTPHWEGFGLITTQGGPQADGEANSKRAGRRMVLYPDGGSNIGGGVAGGEYLRILPLEHSANGPIMDLCLALERSPGSNMEKQWWEQEGLDMEGMQTTAWEAEHTEREEDMDGTEMETG